MTIVYSPDGGMKTTMECLDYIQSVASVELDYTGDKARAFSARLETLDWKLCEWLDQIIEESTDMSAIVKAGKIIDTDNRDLDLDLEINRSLNSAVEKFITDVLYTFGIE